MIQNSKLKIQSHPAVTFSQDLGEIWEKEIIVVNPNEIVNRLLIFADQMPKTANLRIRLTAPKSRAEITVAHLGANQDDSSINIELIHEAPETYGRITVKSALFDKSRLVFRGMLDVRPEAKGSDTYLLAKGLVVSSEARAEMYPYLEIATDEVRASHGSTVGHLDRNHLFYLQSRGIGREEAEKMILAGFFRDVAKEMPAQYAEKFFQKNPVLG